MSRPTLEELRAAPANKEFFRPEAMAIYDDAEMEVDEIIWKGERHWVLRVTSSHGTKPIYKVDPSTHKLTYLTHAEE